jgi:diphthamide synthase subunit DPH2
MWQTQDLETITKERLVKERGQSEGEEKYALYLAARKKLLEDVLEEIKATQPGLTDHGPRHVANVLQNAHQLLGDKVEALSATELYCLILSILFHDVGIDVYTHRSVVRLRPHREQLVEFDLGHGQAHYFAGCCAWGRG